MAKLSKQGSRIKFDAFYDEHNIRVKKIADHRKNDAIGTPFALH